MDYKKKYEEALEKGREFYNRLGNKQLKEEVESIFPELVVSEDERIRQHLIDMLKNDEKCYLKELAWLEKQGEQKPIKSLVDSWKEMRLEVWAQASGNRPCNVSDDNTKMFSLNDVDEIIEKIGDCQIEQKPAEWSEDDQSNFNELSSFILETYRTEDASRLITWLNDIKDRVQLQPRQEWSEEDEKDFNTAIQHIENYVNNTPSSQRPEIWADITKLKSLRPQSHWRPSKEHIMALRWVLNNVPYNRHKEEISGLLEQIKDL